MDGDYSISVMMTRVLNWQGFGSPGDIWRHLETFLLVRTGVLMASHGLRPWRLLSILPYTEPPPATNNYLVYISIVLRPRNSDGERQNAEN